MSQNDEPLKAQLLGRGPRFVSSDREFAVWAARADDGQEVVLVGPLASLSGGERIECAGRWERHRRHGLAFKVTSFRSSLPESREGVAAWLCRLDGVGETFAEAIVDHFGPEKVFGILDSEPQRLTEVKTKTGRSLSEEKVNEAVASWSQSRLIRQIETFLFGLGVSQKLAERLYRRYGEQVVDVISENPYRLSEIPGIGFVRADRIARRAGIGAEDQRRLSAGILYLLDQAGEEGHTYLTVEQLLARAGQTLEVFAARRLGQVAEGLVAEEKIISEKDAEGPARIYAAEIWQREARLARAIRKMGADTAEALFDRRPQVEELDFEPTGDQLSVIDMVSEHRLSILTGGPGVGKSATVSLIVELSRRSSIPIALAAPTGKAARRLEELSGHKAMTIHRLLGFSPMDGFTFNRDNPLEEKLIVIDEASMLSLDLADALFAAIGPDTHLLLVGDTDQLPPIGAGRVLDALIKSDTPRVELRQIFRQAARSMIIQNSRRINSGLMPFRRQQEAEGELGQRMLNDFYWVSRQTPEQTAELAVEFMTRRIPRMFSLEPKDDIVVLSPMRKGSPGLENLNQRLESELNPGQEPIHKNGFAVGSRIICTKNNYDWEIMNGELARVEAFDKKRQTALLSLDDGQRKSWIPISDMDSFYLGWALSVHKAQGSQAKAVVFVCSSAHWPMLSRKLAYTAITRAQELCVVVGDAKALRRSVSESSERPANCSLAQRIKEPQMSGELV